MPKLKDYQPVLAQAIFSQPYDRLDEGQRMFVDYHCMQFPKYRRDIAKMFRLAMEKKKLHDHEYQSIQQMYTDRIHPDVIKAAITDGLSEARKGKQVAYAIGWFHNHIKKQNKIRKEQVYHHITSVLGLENDDPWFYREFCGKHKFDPWWAREDNNGG